MSAPIQPAEETPEQKRAAAEGIRRFQEAYFWFHNQPELCQRYKDQYVILDNQQVVGSGRDGADAREMARRFFEAHGRAMPPERDLIIFIAPHTIWVDAAGTSGGGFPVGLERNGAAGEGG